MKNSHLQLFRLASPGKASLHTYEHTDSNELKSRKRNTYYRDRKFDKPESGHTFAKKCQDQMHRSMNKQRSSF